jgi:hypothetical protein
MIAARLPALLIVAALLLGGCGSSSEATTTTAGESDRTTTTRPASTTTITSPATEATTTTAPDVATTVTIAGTIVDEGPDRGDVLAVVGIAYDDVLNVRALPGLFNDVVDTIEPLGSVTATGVTRDLGRAFWTELDTGSATGWSNLAYLAYPGGDDDPTGEVVEALEGVPVAPTIEELALEVARSMASTDLQPLIAMVVEPVDNQVTFDVVGLGDDAVAGYRLLVNGSETEEGIALVNVVRTWLCARGVDDNGLCV